MGTRADFYVGRGTDAEWLGSVAMDGYPEGINAGLLQAAFEEQFRAELATFLESCGSATLPEQGWPWPWDDSNTTDYAYAFDEGKVWASCFGSVWWSPVTNSPEGDLPEGVRQAFPNMASRKNVAWDQRSGLLFVSSKPD